MDIRAATWLAVPGRPPACHRPRISYCNAPYSTRSDVHSCCTGIRPLGSQPRHDLLLVDGQGKVHYAEVVPEQYLERAKPVGPVATAPSADEQSEALARAAREKARAAAVAPASAPTQPCRPQAPIASALTPKRPARLPDDNTDCDTWARLYRESLDCFGPFRTTRGVIKPEAFDHCNEVREPPIHCRQRVP